MNKVQSVLIPTNAFTLPQAIRWLIVHKYKVTKVDITDNYYRFRQLEPNHKKKYYSLVLPNNIILINYE